MDKKDLLRFASSTPPIETERLILSRLVLADARDMFEYAQLESVTRYLLWSPHPNLHHTRRYLKLLQEKYAQGEFYDWGVHRKSDQKLIGTCGFASIDPETLIGEIGYVFTPKVWGQGYAYEAAKRVLRYGFETLGLRQINARYMLGNSASERVMQKLKMHSVGFLPDQYYIKGEYRSILQYEITNEEYRERYAR